MPDTTQLDGLLAACPGYDKISLQVKAEALNRSLIPDSMGRVPGADGYQPTQDHAYAAMLLLPALQAQAQATTVASEGTTVSTTVTDWQALRAFLASMSPICRLRGQGVFGIYHVPVETAAPGREDSRLGVDCDVE